MGYLFLMPIIFLIISSFISEDVLMSLLMKKVAVDTSAEGIRCITDKLGCAKIKYHIVTTRTRGTIGSGGDARSYARANIALYKFGKNPGFVYSVFVKRKDYPKAKEAIG
ncbi:MAG: hypothetical protein VB108_05130 [Anaerolineaceae bacterium]|nr:hypothetical protein [Anaerolineaceae bacterium]